MENSHEAQNNGHCPGLQITRHSSYSPCNKSSMSWFDIRVFYVRFSNFTIDNSTPHYLTLNHIPLSHDTILEVNGARCPIFSDGASCILRRDRIDKKSEEATFVSTDSIRFTGNMKFEVFRKEDLVLTGILEMSCSNGFTGESKNKARGWTMNCESVMTAGTGFLKCKQIVSSELLSPTIEVYIAGSYSGSPIILTKSLQLNHRKKHSRKGMLDAIPEFETSESQKDVGSALDMQVVDYRNYKPGEEGYSCRYWSNTEYLEGEDGELSWFNAGVRVGVGIGLGVCVGIGVGVGLLARTYQTTAKTFKRRLM